MAQEDFQKTGDNSNGLIFLLKPATLLALSTKTTSIGNFMKNMWTIAQGTIHTPSPGPKESRPKRPFARVAAVSHRSTRSATTAPRVLLNTIKIGLPYRRF